MRVWWRFAIGRIRGKRVGTHWIAAAAARGDPAAGAGLPGGPPHSQNAAMAEHPVRILTMPLDGIEEPDLAPLLAVLDATERARAARFAFAHSRVPFVAAHALTRAALSRLVAAPASAWGFVPGPHGKPAPLLGGVAAPVSFNLSHTRGMVGVALTARPDALLGFDLEAAAREVTPRISESVFRPEERAWLASLPAEHWRCGFLRLWTLKEAFIKATGRGLAQGLDSFWFELPPPRIRFAAPGPTRPEHWLFGQRLLRGTHHAAVGLHAEGRAPAILWEETNLALLLRELAAPQPGQSRALLRPD